MACLCSRRAASSSSPSSEAGRGGQLARGAGQRPVRVPEQAVRPRHAQQFPYGRGGGALAPASGPAAWRSVLATEAEPPDRGAYLSCGCYALVLPLLTIPFV